MLGIIFTHNRDELFHLNYLPKLSRLKSTLHLWSMRDLTPIGRNVIVKTSALSQLVFLFLVLPNPPDSFIKEVETAIFNFLWSGNPDKIKRLSIINTIDEGGLKFIHVKSFMNSLKSTWIGRYCDDSTDPWKSFFDLHSAFYGFSSFSL